MNKYSVLEKKILVISIIPKEKKKKKKPWLIIAGMSGCIPSSVSSFQKHNYNALFYLIHRNETLSFPSTYYGVFFYRMLKYLFIIN